VVTGEGNGRSVEGQWVEREEGKGREKWEDKEGEALPPDL